VYSFSLLISQEASFSGAAQSSNSSALCLDNAPDSSECESPSDFSATSASDFHHRSMLSMLQKLSPALDQVKAWQQAVDPAIDELRQVGYLLPQLMAQIRDSAGQINEFSQQQQRFEVALRDLHSELQRLKSYRCCAADRLSAYVEMLVVNESKVEFGYMDASYPFKGRPRDGHICREDVSRRLRPRTAGISVRYHPPSN
jgi:hypothetical protein